MFFTNDELILMMIYNPGTRKGLIAELIETKKSLTDNDEELSEWINSVLLKIDGMNDAQYEALNLNW